MATIRAVIVETNGTFRDTEIDSGLDTFQGIVGGYIEGVFGSVAVMYVNEEGLLLRLAPNPLATRFAQVILKRDVVLYGTALILGPSDIEGNETPVRQSVVDYFNQKG
jgi:hypothetical protein